jgi:hypothetical protein
LHKFNFTIDPIIIIIIIIIIIVHHITLSKGLVLLLVYKLPIKVFCQVKMLNLCVVSLVNFHNLYQVLA